MFTYFFLVQNIKIKPDVVTQCKKFGVFKGPKTMSQQTNTKFRATERVRNLNNQRMCSWPPSQSEPLIKTRRFVLLPVRQLFYTYQIYYRK